jgi:hypothetical protein
VLRPADVRRGRLLRIPLGPVDVRPRRGVQDEIGGEPGRRRQSDVPVCPGQPDRTGKLREQGGAELPARAGYDDASRAERIGDDVLQRWRTRTSLQGTWCSSGFAASYSSVTRYANRQSESASYPCAWMPGT